MSRLLTQSINAPVVLRMIGWLLMIEALFMLMPVAVSAYYGEWDTVRAFAISAGITVATGALMTFGIRPRSSAMHKREGIILTAVVWVFFSLMGMIPLLLTGTVTTVSDAFFETMAGFTTTGASVISNLEGMTHGVLFWRALMQWIGGMGIILFTLAVLPMLNFKGGIALFNAEVTGITHERLRPRVSQTAKFLWLIYVSLTALMALLLIADMGWFDAVCHSMATLSTGGLSTHDEGINYWHSPRVYIIVTAFMFVGGINFTLLYNLMRGRFSRLFHSDTFKWYLLMAVTVATSITLWLWLHDDRELGFSAVQAAFDTVAAITSTGYQSDVYAYHDEFVMMLLLVLMFFGGMAGSTSGGAKIDRFIVTLKNVKNEFYRVLHGNTVTAVRVDGRAIPHEIVAKVIAFLSIYLLVLGMVALMLTMMGLPMADAFYTSVSTISNQGVGYGVTAASGSFGALPDAAKWLLSFEMMVGRLELFTVLVMFTPSFWIKD